MSLSSQKIDILRHVSALVYHVKLELAQMSFFLTLTSNHVFYGGNSVSPKIQTPVSHRSTTWKHSNNVIPIEFQTEAAGISAVNTCALASLRKQQTFTFPWTRDSIGACFSLIIYCEWRVWIFLPKKHFLYINISLSRKKNKCVKSWLVLSR